MTTFLLVKKAGMVLVVGFLFFILQGCTRPFVEVNVAVDGCCKDGDCKDQGPTAGCEQGPMIGDPGFPAGTYDGITCNSGQVCGSLEDFRCTKTKKCDTQHTAGSTTNCTCACVLNPT